MTNQNQSQTLFTEVFPIKKANIPNLFAYKVEVSEKSDASTIGGKLAYRFKKTFDGHWAWAGGLIVTDSPREITELMSIVKTLWTEQPEIFGRLRDLVSLSSWQPDSRTISEFVARGLFSGIEKEIEQVLSNNKGDIGKAFVNRVHDMRGWVVDGEPAVSVSVSSRMVLKQDLKAYANQVSNERLIGLDVGDKTSSLKGELVSIVGTLATERQRLLSITQREEMQKLLASLPDNDLVVSVSNGRSDYDYAIGALRIILSMGHLKRFQINPSAALAAMRLEPKIRAEIVKEIFDLLAKTGYIDKSYNSSKNQSLFYTNPHSTHVTFGNGTSTQYSEKTIISDLRNRGLYRIADKFKTDRTINVGILNALTSQSSYMAFWEHLERGLRSLGFGVHRVSEITLEEISRVEIETAVTQAQSQSPDIIVGIFPDDFLNADDDETAYHHFKSLTVGRGIPSQVIEESTLDNQKAVTSSVNNIILGILSKTGNIPYVLANPLDFADVIVGIDVARDKKKRLSGSINATAITRVYLNDGDFIQYSIHDAPLEGETIPASVIQSLFPKAIFANKRVVVHRDGYFRGEEKKALYSWGAKIGAKFLLVEVIKSGSPRIYAFENNNTTQPLKGSTFVLSPSEAIIISTLPPFKNATPDPLHIRADKDISIEQAIESVLAMTNLHYGSVRSPRLPVTVHYSDKIAYMALRGIKPKNLEGNIPFWL